MGRRRSRGLVSGSLLGGVLASLLAACGGEPPQAAPAEGPPLRPSTNALDAIATTRKVVVAVHVDSNHKIFCFGSTKPEGFDIDFSRRLVELLGPLLADELNDSKLKVEVEFRYVESWARLIGSLKDPKVARYDLAVASISRTARREEEGMLFSNPYLETELGTISRTDNPGQLTSISAEPLLLSELKTKRVAVHSGTTAETFMRALLGPDATSLETFDNNEDLFRWKGRDGGRIDIVVYDLIRCVPEAFSSRKGFVIKRIEGWEQRPGESYCIAFRPGNEGLRDLVNRIIPPESARVVNDNEAFAVPLVRTRLSWVQELISARIKSTLGEQTANAR